MVEVVAIDGTRLIVRLAGTSIDLPALLSVFRDTFPLTGAVFIFRSRSLKAIKLLVYDGQGFWLCHKRLSSGKFRFWPSRADSSAALLLSHEVHVLLSGGDPFSTHAAPPWKKLVPQGQQMISPAHRGDQRA